VKLGAVTTKLESEKNAELKTKIAKLRYGINEIKQQTFFQSEIISKEMISGNEQNNNTIDSNTKHNGFKY
jgi:hypothetical protein